MKCDILRQGYVAPPTTDPDAPVEGTYTNEQDPLTHEIIRVWKTTDIIEDNPLTLDVNEANFLTVECLARGIMEGGIRVQGTTERFGELYENVDYVRIWIPSRHVVTKRDRITNIRNKQGQILWKDEETNPYATNGWRATEFEVTGVTPEIDPFGRHTANVLMVQKAEVTTG